MSWVDKIDIVCTLVNKPFHNINQLVVTNFNTLASVADFIILAENTTKIATAEKIAPEPFFRLCTVLPNSGATHGQV